MAGIIVFYDRNENNNRSGEGFAFGGCGSLIYNEGKGLYYNPYRYTPVLYIKRKVN